MTRLLSIGEVSPCPEHRKGCWLLSLNQCVFICLAYTHLMWKFVAFQLMWLQNIFCTLS